jgi:hypothetical protein
METPLLKSPKACLVLTAAAFSLAVACSKSSPTTPTPAAPTAPQLTAPALDTPGDDQQLSTLRPELTVKNGTSSQASGTRTYEFQIADNTGFSPVAATGTSVAENAAGKTSFTPAEDLQSTTRMYWRARMVQGTTNSEWSAMGKFKTRLIGFNRPGELYDPLVHGETVGTCVGSCTPVADKGIRLDNIVSYVIYQLPQTIPVGEISMEVEGLAPNGPGGKPKIFQMLDSANTIPSASKNMINAQYRGRPGNPDYSVAFKAVMGSSSSSSIVEPDLAKRNQSVLNNLDPSRTYFWQGIWDAKSFRLVVREGGPEGAVLYDYKMTGSGSGAFGPSPHFVFLGSNYERFSPGTGSFPGMIVRNVWVGSKPRPTSLGSALRAVY